MSVPHRLSISRLSNRIRPGAGGAETWAALVEAAMRGPLPRRIGEEIEARFEGRSEVIRIRHMRILWQMESDLPDMAALAGQLARRIAARIGAAMEQGAGGPPGGPGSEGADWLRVWPDRARYTAAYIRHRLGIAGEAGSGWAFPDFTPLSVLTGAQAAAELLSLSDPPVVAALAASRAEAAQIAAALTEAGCLRALARLIATARPAPHMARRAAAIWTGPPADPAQIGGRVLELCLGRTGPDSPSRPGADLPDLALALLARAALGSCIAADMDIAQMAGPEADLPAGLPPLAKDALRTWSADSRLWADLLHSLPSDAAIMAPGAQPKASVPAAQAGAAAWTHSAFAGLAPLLILCPLATARPEVIREAALWLIPDEAQAGARPDPGFNCLFPADPRAQPELPPAPAPEAWPGFPPGPDCLAGAPRRSGFAAWADLWLALFAGRMPGLQSSSRAWLQREFLLRPGRMRVSHGHLQITLPPFPLAIILRMSGLTGSTARVPHLGLPLLISSEL